MSNKRYWQKTKGTKNFMKIVWKRLWQGTLRSFGESTESPEHNKSLCLYWIS